MSFYLDFGVFFSELCGSFGCDFFLVQWVFDCLKFGGEKTVEILKFSDIFKLNLNVKIGIPYNRL
jgi:hypothetical protein